MEPITWKRRLTLFAQRFWQPTSACMSCMPGTLMTLWSPTHWAIALQTGLATGLLALLLTFTPARRLFHHRLGNALTVGALTMLGDAYSHVNHYEIAYLEPVVTGAVSALITYLASFLFEQRARRLRMFWARLTG